MQRIFYAILIFASLCLLSSTVLAAPPCIGQASVICEPETVQTQLTVAPIALPTVTVPTTPGYSVHLELIGEAVFIEDSASVTGGRLIGDDVSIQVYASTDETLTLEGLAIRLAYAYIGDVVQTRIRVIDPNGATEVIEDATFRVVEVIGFSRALVPMFNPGSNALQVSVLRLTNPTGAEGAVVIRGVDDAGQDSGVAEALIAAGASIHLSAVDLESGTGAALGGLGSGSGKWRLTIDADFAGFVAQSYVRNARTGTLSNLSSVVGSPE